MNGKFRCQSVANLHLKNVPQAIKSYKLRKYFIAE